MINLKFRGKFLFTLILFFFFLHVPCIFCYFNLGNKILIFFEFQLLNQRGERESCMKMKRKGKVIDFATFQHKKLLFSVLMSSVLMVVVLSQNIYRNEIEFNLIFIFIQLVWIFFLNGFWVFQGQVLCKRFHNVLEVLFQVKNNLKN